MITLPNGCQCSGTSTYNEKEKKMRHALPVTPANWNTAKALTKKNGKTVKWCINYRFYDPRYKNDPELWGKQFFIRGMNKFENLTERQAATRILMEREMDLLINQGYNPITGEYSPVATTVEEIQPGTTFIAALWRAFNMLSCVPEMLVDIKSAINGMDRAAGKLFDKTLYKPYTALKIDQVSRRHLVYLLEQCAKDNPKFSNNRYKKYRAYLIMLFKKLIQVEAVDVNPASDLEIKIVIQKKRQILTADEQIIVDTNLKARDYYFWRYMRIFHRSGSRSTEMLALQPDKVDLDRQEFIVLVKKGGLYTEDVRPIPDDILPLWRDVLSECQPGDYLFSVGFRPGPQKIGRDNINKRWRTMVKDNPDEGGMGIKKDFYSLKHLNADQLDEQEGIEMAVAAAGHVDDTMMKKHYAVNHHKRKIEKLKKTSVSFGLG